jgi:hypothetical protein
VVGRKKLGEMGRREVRAQPWSWAEPSRDRVEGTARQGRAHAKEPSLAGRKRRMTCARLDFLLRHRAAQVITTVAEKSIGAAVGIELTRYFSFFF